VSSWRIAGPYFESCNCDAICPCRRVGSRAGKAVDLCQFALAWTVDEGHFEDIDLADRRAVMVGQWDYDGHDWPWQVGMFVDVGASDVQREVLAGILTGRHRGTPSRQYAPAIGTILFVEPAEISVDHTAGGQSINVRGHVNARAGERFGTDARVSCGIPGHDREGYEVVMVGLGVHADGLDFAYAGNCGFAASYDYRSDSEPPDAEPRRRRWNLRRRAGTDPPGAPGAQIT
jgi:hypothetical protein